MDSYFYKIAIKPEMYGADADVITEFISKYEVGDVIIGKFSGSQFIYNKRGDGLPADIVNNEINFIKLDGRLKRVATTGQTNKGATGAVKSKKRMHRRSSRRSSKRIKKTKGRRPHKRRL